MKISELLKKHPVGTSAVTCAVLFGALAFIRAGAVDDLREELGNREKELAQLSENLHNGQQLTAHLTEMDALTKRIADRLSNPTDVAGNQQYFYKLEADSGIKLTDLRQTTGVNTAARTKYSQYSTVSYATATQGDFEHQLTFLRNLESGSRLSTISSMTMGLTSAAKAGEDPGPDAIVQMNLSVQLLCTP